MCLFVFYFTVPVARELNWGIRKKGEGTIVFIVKGGNVEGNLNGTDSSGRKCDFVFVPPEEKTLSLHERRAKK